MNTIIEILTEGPIPLVAGLLSCVLSILITYITKSIDKRIERIEKKQDTDLKIKVNDQELTLKGYSTEEILELLEKLEPKDQMQSQSKEDIT